MRNAQKANRKPAGSAGKSNKPAGIVGENGKARTKKGSKAKQKIKEATLELLSTQSYRDIRVVDVTIAAGVATGLFYHYFKDLPSLAAEVLEQYVAKVADMQAIEAGIAKGDWYSRIYAYNHIVVSAYAQRPLLMRSLFQLADDRPAFSAMLRENFVQQLMWLVDVMPHIFPDAKLSKHERLLVIYSLAASSEVLLRDYFVSEVEALTEEKLNVEQITELLSVLFYRGIFLQNPAENKLKHYAHFKELKQN